MRLGENPYRVWHENEHRDGCRDYPGRRQPPVAQAPVQNPKDVPSNLIPYIMKVAQKKLSLVKVFGKNYKTKDGTGVRDYIHVMDLAEGHVEMLKSNRMKKGLKMFFLSDILIKKGVFSCFYTLTF
jgi:hypothetical protein